MSTNINISNDLNNYLKSSSSSISGHGSNGWFGGDKKGLFNYQLLRNKDGDTDSISGDATSNNGWFSNPFGPKEPQPKSCLPTLVGILHHII